MTRNSHGKALEGGEFEGRETKCPAPSSKLNAANTLHNLCTQYVINLYCEQSLAESTKYPSAAFAAEGKYTGNTYRPESFTR